MCPAPDATAGRVHNAFTGNSHRRNRAGPAAGKASLCMSPDRVNGKRYQAGRLEVRPDEHAALVDGRPLSLTVRELQLLAALASHAERIMTRDELYAQVWGRPRRSADRSLDVYVSRLRAKLSSALPGLPLIHTHTGIGYRFSAPGLDR